MRQQALPTFIVAAALFVLQGILVAVTFPVTELFSELPLSHIDNAAHWYRVTTATNLAQFGDVVGYDPYFNAGTATGIATNPAAKVPALLSILLSSLLTPLLVWKLYVFLSACVAAACVPVALCILRCQRRVVAAAGLLALLLWWVSIFRWYHTAGMVSYVFACYLTLPFAALVYRYLHGTGGVLWLCGIGFFGAVGLLVHPLFPLPVALVTLLFLAFDWRTIDWRRAAAMLTVVPAISLAPNLQWLHLYFIAEPLTVTVPGIRHQAVVDWNLIWMELAGIWRGEAHGSKTYVLVAIAAVAGNFGMKGGPHATLVRTFSVAGLFCIIYAALGASVELLAKLTQPNRFAPLGYLLLTVPAGFGVARLLAWRADALSSVKRLTGIAGLAMLALLTVVNANELRREVSRADVGHYGAVPPEVAPYGPMATFLLDWLERETTPSARVLFETSNARIHDGSHIAGYLAYTADREFIGGSYVFQYFANFTDGFLFGHDIGDFSQERFAEYVDLYNLGWIVAHSPEARQYFDAVPWLDALDTFDTLATYRIDRRHGFFAEGRGRIADRGHSWLELDYLDGSPVVLKYHYMRGLKAEPAVALTPVYLMDDPNPFIRIDNPPRALRLFFD